MRAKVTFCIHLESGQVYCGKDNRNAVNDFAFFFYSISHSNVIHREICVKDFSGTATPRIFEILYKCWVRLVVLCKRESACCCLSFPLFIHFSLSPSRFSVTNGSASVRATVFKFCIHIENGQVYCGADNNTAEIYFAFFFLFYISQSNVMHL